MNLRFYTVYLALLSCTEFAAAANNAAWDCEQAKNGEWTCLNQEGNGPVPEQPKIINTKPPAAAQESEPIVAVPEPVTPEPAKPVIQANEPTESKPVQTATGKPEKLHAKIRENQTPIIEKVPPARSEPTEKIAQVPGWTCKSGDENNNWNCNLVGPDPKGEARIVAGTQPSSFWLTPTYNNQQERMFQTLRSEFKQDPWQNCDSWAAEKPKFARVSNEARAAADTDVTADFSEVFDGEILNFSGNVDLTRADQHLTANKASYDTVADTLDAQNNVIYSESTLALAADTASLSLGKDQARLRQTQFITAEAPMRGTAEVMYRDSASLSRYHEATFTSCPPGNQDWVAHSSRVKINKESGKGSAKNAWLEFKGVPFLYTPYISFPVDDRRTTGLLSPMFRYSQRNGFDFSQPFYWNIAPNYDTIVTPRYMEKRGFMLRNKFRYLTEMSRGTLAGEIVPYDQEENKTRYLGSIKDITQFTPHLRTDTNLNYVSDKTYFNDFNNVLGFQTNRFLPSNAYVNYSGLPETSFRAGIDYYQSVDISVPDTSVPYDRLPRVDLNYAHEFNNLPIYLALNNQYVHFYHDIKVNAQRLNIAPSVSFPFESSAGFFIPKITGEYTQYQLSNTNVPDQATSISRLLPIFSIDSGLTFEKDITLGGSNYVHTLEPRLFYLYIPRKDQTEIPLFDTSAYDTNFYSLFRENRYNGIDRIQNANQITLAGTTRLVDSQTGLEPVKLNLGQIIYFEDRTVDLDYLVNVQAPRTSTTSNFIGEISGQISHHLSYAAGTQWDPFLNSFTRNQIGLKFRNQPNQIFDISYRYRRKVPYDESTLAQRPISQFDTSFRWPIAQGWYGLGRWQYSFDFGETTESFIGIEKETCCWRLRLIGRRYINGATNSSLLEPDAKPENAIFVQLELKGLTGFGNQIDKFLQRGLPGYHPYDYFQD
ncbi:LPS assembly protein LptD [Methylomonas sp. MgM2]